MTPELLMSLCAAKGLSFDSIPGGGRPTWTASDAAIALAGLPADIRTPCYAAFSYRWAGDETQRSVLFGCLMNASISVAMRECWPSRIREQRYLERLVRLAILEERYGFFIKRGNLWVELMERSGFRDIDEQLWERRLSRKYEAVRDVIDSWCGITGYHVSARINRHENKESMLCA